MDREEQIIREYIGRIESRKQREQEIRQLAWQVVLSKGELEAMQRLQLYLRETE